MHLCNQQITTHPPKVIQFYLHVNGKFKISHTHVLCLNEKKIPIETLRNAPLEHKSIADELFIQKKERRVSEKKRLHINHGKYSPIETILKEGGEQA